MIYPRDCEVWRACSKKNGRHPNVTLRRTKAGTRIEATDGRILASIHVMTKEREEPNPGEGQINIDPDAFKEAKRRSRRSDGESLSLELDGSIGTAHVPGGPTFREPHGGGCPDASEARVGGGEPDKRYGFNAKLLLDLAKALGGEQVLIEFHDEGAHVVKIIGDDGEIVAGRYGLIFPVDPR